MRCLARTLGFAVIAAFAVTLLGSPSVNRWAWYHIPPATPADWAPKYRIGGQNVTAEQFQQHVERTT
jgi:hypothetical protein